MDSAELSEWQAYYSIEPFGPAQEDYRAGICAAVTHNSVPREKGAKPAQPQDFFHSLQKPKATPPADDQTEAEQRDTLNLLKKVMAVPKA